MPEAVAAPISPVIATPGGNGQPTAAPAAPARSKATSPMEAKLLEVMGQVNEKHGGDRNEFKSLGEITDQVLEAEKPKPKPAKPADPSKTAAEGLELGEQGVKAAPKPGEPPPKPVQPKEKLQVDGKELELEPDQVKRLAQKGIHWEKRSVEVVKAEQAAAAKAQAADQIIAQRDQFLKNLGENPGELLEAMFGPQVFDKIKPWAAGRVQKEMDYEQNPQQKAIDEANARAAAAEAQLNQRQQQEQQAQQSKEEKQYVESSQKLIMDALKEAGVPSEGVDFAAAEMAGHMSRALARNIEFTPQQLANLVKEDNTTRVKWQVGLLSNRVLEAQKANDTDSILKHGQQLVEMFGEPLMYAIAKFHLAKLGRGDNPQAAGQQPSAKLPAPILEQPRPEAPGQKGWGKNGRQYMTEDEFRETRQKIARGEMEPPPGW